MAVLRASFSIRLFNESGGRSNIRYAKSYQIFYGSRKETVRKSFPRALRTSRQRKEFLKAFIKRLERKKLLDIERKERERELLKSEIRKFIIEMEQRALEELAIIEREEEKAEEEAIKDPIVKRARLARKAVLQFDKAKSEKAYSFNRIKVSDASVVPILSPLKDFKSEQISKRLFLPDGSQREMSTLNLTLNPEEWVRLDAGNFEKKYITVVEKLYPIVYDYWEQTEKSTDSYIFRFKFVWEHDQGQENWGISKRFANQGIESEETLFKIFEESYIRLRGDWVDAEVVGDRVRRRGARDYLKDNAVIYITGFTLEAANRI